jgi:hypothetical protein
MAIAIRIATTGIALAGLFSACGGGESKSGQAASCSDEAGDVVRVVQPGGVTSGREPELIPDSAPLVDIRAVELQEGDGELLVRVLLDGDWEPDTSVLLNAPRRSMGSYAQVTMADKDGDRYLIQMRSTGADIFKAGEAGQREKEWRNQSVGHEGPVVEVHMRDYMREDLAGRFDWFVFTQTVADLDLVGNGRTLLDQCGTEENPIGFPGKPLDIEDPGTSTTTVAPAPPADDPLEGLSGSGNAGGRPTFEPGPDCVGVSACVYNNGIDFSQLREAITAGIEAKVGDRPEATCDSAGTKPPNQVRTGETFACGFAGARYYGQVDVLVGKDGGWRWTITRSYKE